MQPCCPAADAVVAFADPDAPWLAEVVVLRSCPAADAVAAFADPVAL